MLALLAAIFMSGCNMVRQELGNRGGYADYVADKYWMKADSKMLRVLRAYALQAALARIAVIAPRGIKDRSVIALRMQQSNIAYASARACAEVVDPISYAPRGCIYFDDAIVAWTNDLFALALASLSLEDGESFIGKVSGGGLDALQALFELGKDAFVLGRAVGALYRDTVELEVVVWLDDPNMGPRTEALRAAYANGAGSLEQWKVELDHLKQESASLPAATAYPVPRPAHFEEIAAFIARSCVALTSEPQIRAICATVPATSPAQTVSATGAGQQANSAAQGFTGSVKAVARSFEPKPL